MKHDPQTFLGRTCLNVDRAGGDDLAAITAIGFDGIRVPVTIADAGPPQVKHDLRAYLSQARVLGLKILLVLDRDAFYWPDWSRETDRYVRFWLDYYVGLFDAFQIGNEADHTSPSSWDLPADQFSALLAAVRETVGPDVYLVAGGMASGQPDYLARVDLSSVDAYGLHLYAKDAPNPDDTEDWPDIDLTYHQYEQVSTLPAILTEWGFPGGPDTEARQAQETAELVVWAGTHGTSLYLYNWRDGGESYGLLRADGSPKPVVDAIRTAIAGLPSIGTVPEPTPVPATGPAGPDPWAWFSPGQIAAACDVPEANVRATWPAVVSQLALVGLNERAIQRAIIPTIAIETGGPDRSVRFTPVREAYWKDDAYRQAQLEYFPYYGRGLIQTTWRQGYLATGRLIATLWKADPSDPTFDLLTSPDNLLDPDMAAAALACFWRDTRALPSPSYPDGYTLVQASRDGDTEWVRRLVQGGTAGLERLDAIWRLLGDPAPDPSGVIARPPVVYLRDYPPILQNDDWSCWPTSARWLLGAIGADADQDGLPPTEAYVEGQAVRDGIVSQAQGLLVAGGGPGAAWLNDQWLTAMGLTARAYQDVSYEELVVWVLEGGCLAGGRAWNHWVALTGVTPQGEITMMNPDPNYRGVGTVLSREEFAGLGPFSAIAVTIGEQEDPAVIADLQQQVAQLTQERDEHKAARERLVTYFAQAIDVDGDAIAAAVARQRAYRAEAIGPRPPAAS